MPRGGAVTQRQADLLGDAPSSILRKDDCLTVLRELEANHQQFVDLVYIDPPFNSGQKLRYPHGEVPSVDFGDTWGGFDYNLSLEDLRVEKVPGQIHESADLAQFIKSYEDWTRSPPAASYLTAMATRLPWIRSVMKETGSFYLHCDPTMSHPLKILCDMVFGRTNFRNEIIWHYRKWTNDAKSFQRNHDILLFYTKSGKYTFNKQYDLTAPAVYSAYARGWDTNRVGGIKQLIVYDKAKAAKKIALGNYDRLVDREGKEGVGLADVWPLPYLSSRNKERVGYPTQKPLALAERIIAASSNEGDLVADFFCGCGTTIAAAHKLGRKWIGCDISQRAINVIARRLNKDYGISVFVNDGKRGKKKPRAGDIIVECGKPQSEQEAKALVYSDPLARKFELWVVEDMLHGTVTRKGADGGIDGKFHYDKPDNKSGVCLIQVKGGNATIAQVKEFAHTLKLQERKADMGVFVCFRKSGGMGGIANEMGYVKGTHTPRLQIITVAQLLAHQRPIPPVGLDAWPI